MSTNKYDKNKPDDEQDEDSGSGGKSGAIEFRDFLSSDTLRDDLMPPDVVKRLLGVHQEGNEARVKAQKEKRDQRQQLKEGKAKHLQTGLGKGAGKESRYKPHPLFEKSPQFHDPQVTAIPTDQVDEVANKELQNRIENEYRLKYKPDHTPKSTPRLLRQ